MESLHDAHRTRSILAHEHLLGDDSRTWTIEQKRLDAESGIYIKNARDSNMRDKEEFAANIRQIIEKHPTIFTNGSMNDDENADLELEDEDETGLNESASDPSAMSRKSHSRASSRRASSPLSERSSMQDFTENMTQDMKEKYQKKFSRRVSKLRAKLWKNNSCLAGGVPPGTHIIRTRGNVPDPRGYPIEAMLEAVTAQIELSRNLLLLRDNDKRAEAMRSFIKWSSRQSLVEDFDGFFSELKEVKQNILDALEQQTGSGSLERSQGTSEARQGEERDLSTEQTMSKDGQLNDEQSASSVGSDTSRLQSPTRARRSEGSCASAEQTIPKNNQLDDEQAASPGRSASIDMQSNASRNSTMTMDLGAATPHTPAQPQTLGHGAQRPGNGTASAHSFDREPARSNSIDTPFSTSGDKIKIRLSAAGRDTRHMYWNSTRTRDAFFQRVERLFPNASVGSVVVHVGEEDYMVDHSEDNEEWEMMCEDLEVLLGSGKTKVNADVRLV